MSSLGDETNPSVFEAPFTAPKTPAWELLESLEAQFSRLGALLIEQCREPIPIPPILKHGWPDDVFEADLEVLEEEVAKGMHSGLDLRLQGAPFYFGRLIAGANSGRPFSLEHNNGFVILGVYTDQPLTPIIYGDKPRSFLQRGEDGYVAMIFVSAEMPPVIADHHELMEANQERAQAGELRELGREPHHTSYLLVDYQKKLGDKGARPHYLGGEDCVAIIRMLDGVEPYPAWTLDQNISVHKIGGRTRSEWEARCRQE